MGLRIALFTLEYPPSHTGGLGVHVGGLAKYLCGRGDTVDVFYVGSQPPPPGVIAVPPFEWRGSLADLLSVERVPGADTVLARHRATPYDVVHCHDWHGAHFAAALWSRGAPVVTTCHLPVTTRFHYAGQDNVDTARALESLVLRLSRCVIAVSEFVALELERVHRTPAHKLRVIHNGTDVKLFAPSEAATRSSLVLAVGRLTAQKGFKTLLEVFREVRGGLANARLRIVGAGPDERALMEHICTLGLMDAVDLHPFVDASALRSHYQDAAVVAVPSVYEPFGLVAIEAMACGVPVVGFATGGLREIVTDGVNGVLVPPHDRTGFANALATLLADRAHAQSLGRQARLTALAHFRGDVSYARTRATYDA
jgi:glycosyltransferase involved in cell wall biosynthesis